MPVEVAWDQLTIPGDAPYYAVPGYFETTIFEPLAAGLRDVTKDQMGRDACGRSLKRFASVMTRRPPQPRPTKTA